MALEIFKLVGSILVDNNAANESLSKTDSKAQGVGKTLLGGLGTAAKWGAAIASGAAAATAGMVKLASNTAETCDNIDETSKKIGISTDAYQEWSYAMGQCGMDADTMTTGMKTLSKAAEEAEAGNNTYAASFKALGVSLTDSNGNMKDQETIMNECVSSLANMKEGTERTALASALFGKAGVNMGAMLDEGAGGIQNMKERAHELGLVLDENTVSAGGKLADTLETVKSALSAVVTNLGGALVPIIQDVCDLILNNMPAIQAIVAQLAPVISGLLSGLLPPLTDLVSEIFPILCDLLSAILPIITTAASAVLPLIVQLIKIMLPPLIQIINMVLPLIQQLLPPILDLLSPLLDLLTPILDVLMLLLEPQIEILNDILPPIIAFINDLVQAVLPSVKAALESVRQKLADFRDRVNEVKEKIGTFVDTVKTKFEEFRSKVQEKIQPVIDKFNDFRDKVKEVNEKISDFVDSIKAKFNFTINWPHIPMPHFNVTPSGWKIGDLLKGTLPHLGVQFYAKAMDAGRILTRPTIFGYDAANGTALAGGEAGSETVVGTNSLMQMVRSAAIEATASKTGELVAILQDILEELIRMAKAGFYLDTGALVGGLAEPMDEALGRLSAQKARA